MLSLALSPAGSLHLDMNNENQEQVSQETAEKLESLFKDNFQDGLLDLSLIKFTESLPPSFLFWQKFSERFMTAIRQLSDQSNIKSPPFPSPQELEEFMLQAPFMKGNEYLTAELLETMWTGLYTALLTKLQRYGGNLQAFLKAQNFSWHAPSKVYFQVIENGDNEAPFTFSATYTTPLSNQTLKHLPLANALEEYGNNELASSLLEILIPIQRAALKSNLIQKLINSGDIFKSLTWTAEQTYIFLKDVKLFEDAGIAVNIPKWWNPQKPPRPQIALSVGQTASSIMGLQGMVDFEIKITANNGEELSAEESQEMLNSKEPFIKLKGQWVEVDQDALSDVLAYWKAIKKNIDKRGLTFAEGVRFLAGAHMLSSDSSDAEFEQISKWSSLKPGCWLKQQLDYLRHPEQFPEVSVSENIIKILNKHLHATLRPYQVKGVQWLWLLYNLKLGGCLADDMGLGKTIQMLSLILLIKHHQNNNKPHLLVVPASLLSNWQQEIKRFAPALKVLFIHPSLNENYKENSSDDFEKFDLVITTYALAYRLESLIDAQWDMVILDEAQAIKNPTTKQAKAVKALKSSIKFVLTGTPIENSLSDLWSLFDFFAPELLGSSREFNIYSKKSNKVNDPTKVSRFNAIIRTLASPYILRRLKTDKNIICDLPDKTEIDTYCSLSKEQILLYQRTVEELKMALEANNNAIKRKNIIFSYLMRFKQICNHPSQGTKKQLYEPALSGKFLRIKEICEEIAAKQEKVLIFTQFQEIITPLSAYLSTIFKCEGLVMHGGTPIKDRAKLVEAFAQEQGPPFFILSLKTGGTGLNLTNATHVIHFDRWWNPAIEQQATDRAYRMGQKRNVMVYKFICRGTIEEKINELLNTKKMLSTQLLESEDDILLTELTNEQLIGIVSLDIHKAFDEQ